MIRLKGKNKGFTLIEIMIVLVIIGIIAGFAIPQLGGFTARAYRAEANSVIQQTRASLSRLYSQTGAYTGGNTPANLDFDYSNAALTASGQTVNFTYAVAVPTPTTYTITALGKATPTIVNGKTVTMDQAGAPGGTL